MKEALPGGGKIIFSETQRFKQWWVWLIVFACAVIAWWAFVQQIIFNMPFGNRPAPDFLVIIILIFIGIGLPAVFFSTKMTTQVSADKIVIRFFPFSSREIKTGEIKSAVAIDYRPVPEYGGWGIRWAPGRGMAYNISGTRGVKIDLVGGKMILIGSRNADELEAAINSAVK